MPNGKPTNDEQTTGKLMADLTYANYRHNRQVAPQIEPERWNIIFGKGRVKIMEERYQRELAGRADV